MDATPEKVRVTFAEYDALPETNQIVELIDGEIVMNPPVFRHQKVLLRIVATLLPLNLSGELCIAPCGLRFDDGNSFEPDLFWVSLDNTACVLEPNGNYWHGAPDLVIEVLSPSTEANDRGKKFRTYQQYGVREYWLVNPDVQFVEVYAQLNARFEQQGVILPGQAFTSEVLSGVSIDVTPWFAA
ncbi:MAG: Uma2 family endonuclease [Anaerolineae bacterium]|nr:Uma2 family endonuclease [Anaerolineae bacterium]